MFRIADEIMYRKIAAAPEPAWSMISLCARNSPAADDQESLIDYAAICERIGSVLIDSEPGAPPPVDDSWCTKKLPKEKALEGFPAIENV